MEKLSFKQTKDSKDLSEKLFWCKYQLYFQYISSVRLLATRKKLLITELYFLYFIVLFSKPLFAHGRTV